MREECIAVSIDKGIILLIENDGSLNYYRQRGINTLAPNEILSEMQKGNLDQRWKLIQELPRNYSIYFEDEEIMGRAKATYQLVLDKAKANRKKDKN